MHNKNKFLTKERINNMKRFKALITSLTAALLLLFGLTANTHADTAVNKKHKLVIQVSTDDRRTQSIETANALRS